MYKNCHRKLAPILLLAFLAAAFMATQGIDHDQLIFYQAGLRGWAGQLPYRDYTIPQGPLAGILFTFFLWMVPFSGGWAFVCASGALNAFAAFWIWKIVRKVSDDRAALVASLVTALWFLTVFGSYYNDHLAYVLVLATIALLSGGQALAAGIVFALACHTKQTVAIGSALALLVSELCFGPLDRRARWRRFALGFFAVHSLFFVYLLASGSLGAYWRSVVRAPWQFAARSPGKSPARFFTFLLLPWLIDPLRMLREHGGGRLAYYPVALAAYFAGYTLYRRKVPRETAWALTVLLLSTLWGACLLGRFHGQLFFGMGGVLALTAFAWGWRWRYVLAATVPLAILNVAIGATWVRERDVLYQQTDLRPIRIEKKALTENNRKVAEYLRDKPGALAVTGGGTYFVAAALRRAPWNPTVYFEFPLTVPLAGPLLDAWEDAFIGALEKHAVRFVVADATWSDKDRVSRAKGHVIAHYRQVFSAGPLLVLERLP